MTSHAPTPAGLLSASARTEGDLAVWRAQLEAMPTWVIRGALDERRLTVPNPVVRLPGLVVDPVGRRVVWRGQEHFLTGRMMEVVHVLAQARQRGYRRLPTEVVALRVWRGFDRASARTNLRVAVSQQLNKRVPGLVLTPGRRRPGVGYGLAIDEAAEGVA